MLPKTTDFPPVIKHRNLCTEISNVNLGNTEVKRRPTVKQHVQTHAPKFFGNFRRKALIFAYVRACGRAVFTGRRMEMLCSCARSFFGNFSGRSMRLCKLLMSRKSVRPLETELKEMYFFHLEESG